MRFSSPATYRWLSWAIGGACVLTLAGLLAAWWLTRRIDPFVREQTLAYLQNRFASRVNLRDISISVSSKSPLQALLNRGRGGRVHIRIRDLSLNRRNEFDRSPVIQVAEVKAEVDLASLWSGSVLVSPVGLKGLKITIPAKRTLPASSVERLAAGGVAAVPDFPSKLPNLIIDDISADDTRLTIIPRDSSRAPLVFDIHRLHMRSVGAGVPLRYTATLKNATPPGLIQAEGSFGPWEASSPAETPLSGQYDFRNADLGVFKGIEGTLSSTGKFRGRLSEIEVEGESRTLDFRLKSVGNRVPLRTRFKALVDGTNGNTLLQPLHAILGSSRFNLQGGVVRYRSERGKTVDLDVQLIQGEVEDLLRLAMRAPKPFLRGDVALRMKFVLPPGQGEIADRLKISGTFSLDDAHFTSPAVASRLDELSRRGQGQPKDLKISEVPARLAGDFVLAQGQINFSRVGFSVPGAVVDLLGGYNFGSESLDFRGSLKLDAKVSQTQSGWKRWALKPVDPFFSKHGAGTYLPVAITGPASAPKFGRDRKR